jgi:hypothetical protein
MKDRKIKPNEYQKTITLCTIRDQQCSGIWTPINPKGIEDCSNCEIAERRNKQTRLCSSYHGG